MNHRRRGSILNQHITGTRMRAIMSMLTSPTMEITSILTGRKFTVSLLRQCERQLLIKCSTECKEKSIITRQDMR
jgi:hypothetical protein